MTSILIWALVGYLLGSVSFSYLITRWFCHIDLRQYGSRKLSGSNVYAFAGTSGLVLAGLLDVAKAALPAWAAFRWGPGRWGAVAAGLGAVVGHNWSIYLGLKGGRGISAALGMLLVVFWQAVLWTLAWLALGRLVPAYAAFVGYVGILLLPMLAVLFGGGLAALWACIGFVVITTAKRLEGNRDPPPEGESWRAVLWRRLWLDRDIVDWQTWATRVPDQETATPSTEETVPC